MADVLDEYKDVLRKYVYAPGVDVEKQPMYYLVKDAIDSCGIKSIISAVTIIGDVRGSIYRAIDLGKTTWDEAKKDLLKLDGVIQKLKDRCVCRIR